MSNSFHDRVTAVLQEVLGEPQFAAALQSGDLLGDGLIDSFALLELTARLEVAFDIVLPPSRIGGQDYRSLANLTSMCQELARPGIA